MNTFKSLGLSENLLEVLEQMGFTKPTPIQEQSIPLLLDNSIEDFIGLAQTGTGKTAAFGLPLIDLVDATSKETQALILAPTRELGQQTAKQIIELSANYKKLNVEVVYGGAAIANQIRALQKPTQIVVATPGRLLDLIRRKAISLSNVRYLVLDEADEMLNMGFKDDIDAILSNIKVPHNTWLFSATMPSEIRKIVKKYMNNPKEVSVNTIEKTNSDITHQYVVTRTGDKLSALQRFLDIHPEMRGIMFCRTKRETQEISDQLAGLGYETEALHGDLSQAQRDAAMNRFKGRNMQLLVATDVAARGIDVSDLTHVLHHKLPDQLEGYTHRSGRTGRAGKKGLSIAFINSREGKKISELERKLKVKFEAVEVPSVEDLKEVRLQRWANQILSMPVSPEAQEVYKGIESQFGDLSKEDLLQRLLAKELKQLNKGTGGDLNVSSAKSKSDHAKRFFVNIGSEDGLTEGDLLSFLSEVGDVPIQSIGDIALQRKRAFFDLTKEHAKGFPKKFDGLELEGGHAIRVNEENNRSSEKGKPGRGGGFRGKGGGRSKQRNSSKGRGYSKRK